MSSTIPFYPPSCSTIHTQCINNAVSNASQKIINTLISKNSRIFNELRYESHTSNGCTFISKYSILPPRPPRADSKRCVNSAEIIPRRTTRPNAPRVPASASRPVIDRGNFPRGGSVNRREGNLARVPTSNVASTRRTSAHLSIRFRGDRPPFLEFLPGACDARGTRAG